MREGPGSDSPVVYNVSCGHYIAVKSGPPSSLGNCCVVDSLMPGQV